MLQQLSDLFQVKTKDAIKGAYLIQKNNEKHMKDKMKAYYATDRINNGADLHEEISSWMKYWASNKKDINSLFKALKYTSDNNLEVMFLDIKKVMNILLTTSATSASVERARPALSFIKTDCRSTMSEDRFNALQKQPPEVLCKKKCS